MNKIKYSNRIQPFDLIELNWIEFSNITIDGGKNVMNMIECLLLPFGICTMYTLSIYAIRIMNCFQIKLMYFHFIFIFWRKSMYIFFLAKQIVKRTIAWPITKGKNNHNKIKTCSLSPQNWNIMKKGKKNTKEMHHLHNNKHIFVIII